MEGDEKMNQVGGKAARKMEERQAAMAIEAKQKAALRRRAATKSNSEAKEHAAGSSSLSSSGSSSGFSKKPTAPPAGGGASLQKNIRARDQAQKAKAEHDAIEGAKSPELRAAELIQALWFRRQYNRGRRASPFPRKKTEPKKTAKEVQEERAAAVMQARQRGAIARKAARTGPSYGNALQTKAGRQAELEAAMTSAGAIVGRCIMRLARKRSSRRWVRDETRRRNEAAVKLQMAQRGKRIRAYVGYKGATDAESGRPHGKGRMVFPDASYCVHIATAMTSMFTSPPPHSHGHHLHAHTATAITSMPTQPRPSPPCSHSHGHHLHAHSAVGRCCLRLFLSALR